MAEVTMLLCEASREARRGSGRVALTTAGAEKKSLERRLGTGTFVAESNGILKGRAMRELCETSRLERAGRAKK
jgi:hypothetical protein